MSEVRFAGDAAVVERFEALPAKVRAALGVAVADETAKTVTAVKTEKLSGQVLHQRTRRLVTSIHGQMSETPHSITGIVGTDVKYAAYHEYGFHGTEEVKAHLMHMVQAFGHPLKEPRDVMVRAHSRRVDYPARSFLRSTLHEREAEIRAHLRAAVAEAIAAQDSNPTV